jgi:hypothetical protein
VDGFMCEKDWTLVVFVRVFPPKICMHLCPLLATCFAHPTLFDIIILMSNYEHKQKIFSSCSFLQSLVTSYPLVADILLVTWLSSTLICLSQS